MNKKELFYNEISKDWLNIMNVYEVNKRLDIVFKKILTQDITNKSFLDVGCGIGLFSEQAFKKGAKVTSLDVGAELMEEVKKRCVSKRVIGSVLELPFEDNTFDIVLATEVLEHTPNPKKGFLEILRVTKPGGIAIVTLPNKVWKFSVYAANILKIRQYRGLENWLYWFELRNLAIKNKHKIRNHFGFNIIPIFEPPFYKLIDFMDRFGNILKPIMVNTTLVVLKKDNT